MRSCSTGPVNRRGKKRSRRNALRHGLTAETVIDALEDAEEYAAFQMTVTADYDARTAIKQELVLRLASVLWRLRRATAIESGLFEIQARSLLQFRRARPSPSSANRSSTISTARRLPMFRQSRFATETDHGLHSEAQSKRCQAIRRSHTVVYPIGNLPACPLDRLSRYEATLWRRLASSCSR